MGSQTGPTPYNSSLVSYLIRTTNKQNQSNKIQINNTPPGTWSPNTTKLDSRSRINRSTMVSIDPPIHQPSLSGGKMKKSGTYHLCSKTSNLNKIRAIHDQSSLIWSPNNLNRTTNGTKYVSSMDSNVTVPRIWPKLACRGNAVLGPPSNDTPLPYHHHHHHQELSTLSIASYQPIIWMT